MTSNPYVLAAELARPVARGWLPLGHAHAALLATALANRRSGSPYDPFHVFKGLRHILDLHLEAEERRRAVAEMRMKRRLRPLIALRKPRNVLLAEAHGVNGADRFPFTEDEVTDITAAEVSRENSRRRFNHVR